MDQDAPETGYGELVRKLSKPAKRPARAEHDLDSLIDQVNARSAAEEEDDVRSEEVDLIQHLRNLVINDLLPVFVELREKYAKVGVSMSMDASPFLAGGREIGFEFKMQGHRLQMIGTVTTDVIAFCETRFSPDIHGELVSGPMLRIRQLTADRFRDFICDRLAVLVRASGRWR